VVFPPPTSEVTRKQGVGSASLSLLGSGESGFLDESLAGRRPVFALSLNGRY